MLTIRRMLLGEERVYNDAIYTRDYGTGRIGLEYRRDEKRFWVVEVVGDGSTIIESTAPCSVRFRDGGRTAIIEALEEIAHDTDNVRHARVVARRALREVEDA